MWYTWGIKTGIQVFGGKLEGESTILKASLKMRNNIKMQLTETGREPVDWVRFAGLSFSVR